MYFVYILLCSDKSLYTGITTDLERRFGQHAKGKGGHYTRSRKVLKMVYSEKRRTKSSALKREAKIKSWSKEKKMYLIRSAQVAK